MRRTLAFLLLALVIVTCVAFALAGCDGAPKFIFAQGTVMYVTTDAHDCRSTVVIKGDNGSVFSIPIEGCSVPPVWQGMHGIFEYEAYENGYYHNLQVVKILD